MTTIFTRNLAIFVLSMVLLKCIISMHSNNIFIYNRPETEIANHSEGGIVKLAGNETVSEKFCLGANTGFSIRTKDNSVGTVNITRSYGTYSIQKGLGSAADTPPTSDLIAENKVIIRVTPQLSEIIDQRMRDSMDVEYILSGTELQEIYSNSNIVKIEKIKLKSNQGEYYLLELDSNMETSSYGEKYLSRIDKIRRFTNF